ncbi:unnamed protein product [Didymodactylos carnosus]|uniref:Uncharacterized protein n=1 Tax=Didymodactylos carnosus TaxID=1234261 RepID=A0A814RWT6_9BILA|nr:unnamed protein product [Didymodactylos carnosus]CAF3902166.1 unnamed protein product [Didymodactylos carnosus]
MPFEKLQSGPRQTSTAQTKRKRADHKLEEKEDMLAMSDDAVLAVMRKLENKNQEKQARWRFGIPAPTIRKHKLYNSAIGAGRETALAHEYEDTKVKILVAYDEWGYPRSCRETLDLVKQFV